MITTQELTKTYGDGTNEVHANRGISLSIAAGEFVVLAGPSGSGKTTLLNLIGGLDSATSGSITVNGSELTRLSPRALSDFRRDQIGYVFQKSNLVGSLTVYENAVLQLRVQRRLTSQAASRTRDLLAEVGLGDKLSALPRQLSGGQQQRAAIIRAVTSGTAVVVADEPTASLDAHNADGVLSLLRQLNDDDGTTIVVSSHDDRVMAAGRRIVYLADGRLVT